MSMPLNIVLIRHGQSEINLIHKAERSGKLHEAHDVVYANHDWQHRLTDLGISQAKSAGKWLKDNLKTPDKFDRAYVSTYQRAIETAYYVGDEHTMWHVDDRFRERDWGEFGATPEEERKRKFPYTIAAQESNYFYTSLNGGESLSTVQMRVRDIIGTFHRDLAGKDVIAVCHGELMMVIRYVLERLMPEEAVEIDRQQDMKNCTIIHYSRVNPDDPKDIAKHIGWMRMIYPYDESNSPHGGKWQPIIEKRVLSGAQLKRRLQLTPPHTRKEE
ncbi:histidine phosphatase family protein [Candidatus Saccharibacteria bacterium]|nr:histidine phosphatase family protein [Candidatus Saccharibacteria bacterium]MCB9821587.1 histidine phosphatase family protein [Candidatus Nomurabacteria bacterium]